MALSANLKQLVHRLNGSTIDYNSRSNIPILQQINQFEEVLQKRTDAQLQAFSLELKDKANNGVPLDELLSEVYALVREAAVRTVAMRPFDVQVLGAIAMHQGRLIEMQTGEGKTLAAVFPAFLNALTCAGVHVLTFNNYLARRDAHWMAPIYTFLGASVGAVQEGMSIAERQNAYSKDITYLTAKEAGFDYLRDSLCYGKENIVHRPFNFAVIDEADSILIDEARIPLVIAGADDEVQSDCLVTADVARRLEAGVDFDFDEYSRNIHLTDQGQHRAENLLHCRNLYRAENLDTLTRLHCALHAEHLLLRDVDYIVRDGKIELVDEFTGRIAEKRRWPDGLQAAIEAKENISAQSKGHILNSITLQHFIQLYPKICGMTATALDGEAELKTFYNLDITVIPPNQPCVRQDHEDVIFRTRAEKNEALLEEIARVHQQNRPILVGTASVKESALLAKSATAYGIPCAVLNAKRDAYEAEIIAEAGRPGAVTISTNMAGRGTDIRLGGSDESEKQAVVDLGGLYVIGAEKHETERIDRQLRGRAGRQGDPGSSRYFISMEDDLMKKYRLDELLPDGLLSSNDRGEITHSMVRKEIARVQRICDGQNLEIKKTLWKYSDLLEDQRQVLSDRRQSVIEGRAATEFFAEKAHKALKRFHSLGAEKLDDLCRKLTLFKIDQFWVNYLAEIADIREGIHLKRIGGLDPFIEFQKMAVQIFDERWAKLDEDLIALFNSLDAASGEPDLASLGIKGPSATWTYLINDNPFENILGIQLIGNMGMQAMAGVLGPLMALQLLFRKKKRSE
jgi:preprotein translocase subunit SecA